ncbi:hypothetical protein TSUD_127590 [Trifolium subterraneum]|nr:hypothetical protein TSUD_127590 [Trifolium subterraneum]
MVKLIRYWKVWEQLQRERNDSRGVCRCIQELRMKGASFDLSKELPLNGKKMMKSSSVEIKWKVVWFFLLQNLFFVVCDDDAVMELGFVDSSAKGMKHCWSD